MIAVTGATGQLGRLVISSLQEKVSGSEIIALVRNPEKAADLIDRGIQVRKADYSDPSGWNEALKGVDKVLLISSSEVGQRTEQHAVVINAVKESGVKLLAYTSILHADTSSLGLAGEHRETEELIRNSGIPFVFLRNGWYTENYTGNIANILNLGTLYGCAGNGRISSATRADFAKAAARVLIPETLPGSIYELAGSESFTLSDFASEISRQSGKEIPYVNLSESDYKEALVQAGLPELFAELLANSETGVAKGDLFDESGQLTQLLNGPTTTLDKAVRDALK